MTAAKWTNGLEVVERVYGPGSSKMMDGLEASPLVAEIVTHVFGDVWALPHLSIRDKRLLVIGATTMLGRADLLETQLAGALANCELTNPQLDEMLQLMLFYAGAGSTTALHQAIRAAKARSAGTVEAKAQEKNA